MYGRIYRDDCVTNPASDGEDEWRMLWVPRGGEMCEVRCARLPLVTKV
jgi:hypothetical protein